MRLLSALRSEAGLVASKVHAQRQGRSGRMDELRLVWACIPAAWKEVLRIEAQADVARKRGPSFPAVSNLYVIGGAGGGMIIGAAIQSVYEVASLSEARSEWHLNQPARKCCRRVVACAGADERASRDAGAPRSACHPAPSRSICIR